MQTALPMIILILFGLSPFIMMGWFRLRAAYARTNREYHRRTYDWYMNGNPRDMPVLVNGAIYKDRGGYLVNDAGEVCGRDGTPLKHPPPPVLLSKSKAGAN